jgi:2-polyprenyl-3-methyl-5-hydroxy-6-metoxy-1,4-benzoquinol methylase
MWNHNNHYHNYLLGQIPEKVDRVLDVGCGAGLFAGRLAERANVVDALDVDSIVLAEASRYHPAPNISYIHADFLTADLSEASYDVIVSIASIHHMDLEAALRKMKLLLRPSGKLLILGLYQERTLVDYAYSAISVPLNFVFLKWHQPSTTVPTTMAPTLPAQLSLKQIAVVANTFIPNFSLRRHLFWRYSLVWQKP